MVEIIVRKQQEFSVGDSVVIPDCAVKYRIQKIYAPVHLKKIKKDYLNLCKLKPPSSASLADGFLEYLNALSEE